MCIRVFYIINRVEPPKIINHWINDTEYEF
jgi:hypothetical protein